MRLEAGHDFGHFDSNTNKISARPSVEIQRKACHVLSEAFQSL